LFFENKELNRNIPVPLYYQLKQLLLNEINAGNLKEHDCLPTEIELSSRFNISRPTVRQAIYELVNEGYLSRLKGKGTFVTKPKINQEIVHVIENFNEGMIRKGIQPKTTVLELKVIEADDEIIQALEIEPGDKVIELSRLRYANEEPIVLVTTYIPYALCPEILHVNLKEESMYQTFEKYNLYIKKVRRVFEAQKATKPDAQLLEIEEGDPLMYFETKAALENGLIIEYSKCRYRGDRNTFVVELTK
jgi:GntR family transcriptional regulator